MSLTRIADVEQQVKEYWSDLMREELLESNLMVNLINKDYQGAIQKGGDTVYVSQIKRPNGATKTIGESGYDVYSSEKLSTARIEIKADKIFEAGFEFDSIVELQSQIGDQDSKIRMALREAIEIQINNFVYGLLSASNKTGAVTDFNASQVSGLRKFAGQKKWRKDGQWYLIADPSYHTDLLNAQTLTSADYVGDRPVIAGQIGAQRFGWNIFEDNSDGLLNVIKKAGGAASEDVALGFHRDFLHLVIQKEMEFKISDLHAMKRRGYLITAEMIGGGAKGHDHDDLHKVIYNA